MIASTLRILGGVCVGLLVGYCWGKKDGEEDWSSELHKATPRFLMAALQVMLARRGLSEVILGASEFQEAMNRRVKVNVRALDSGDVSIAFSDLQEE